MTDAVLVAMIAGGAAVTANLFTYLSSRARIEHVATKVEESKAQNVAISKQLDTTAATVEVVKTISDGRLTEALEKITMLNGLVKGLQAVVEKHNGNTH